MYDNRVSKGFPALWRGGVVAKPCDYCKSASALLFCRVDLAFMCAACDAKVHHDPTINTRHQRVCMCDVCEQAPASVTCKADAAALCLACDRDIHSANPLAQRHERIPVVPFYDTTTTSTIVESSTLLQPPPTIQDTKLKLDHDHPSSFLGNGNTAAATTTTTDSWISSNPIILPVDLKPSMEFLISDSDPFLDFDYQVTKDNNYYINPVNDNNDCVVPVQTMKPPVVDNHHSSRTCFDIDFTRSCITSYNNNINSYTTPRSLTHSVSSSSLDMGIVPEGSSISETSYPFGGISMSGTGTGTGTGTGSETQAFPIVGKEREARVLRYREKRKNRKFEKTIRYASRKAYAETRPRVKGRFAKRSSSTTIRDVECDIDQLLSFSEARFGVVPSLY